MKGTGGGTFHCVSTSAYSVVRNSCIWINLTLVYALTFCHTPRKDCHLWLFYATGQIWLQLVVKQYIVSPVVNSLLTMLQNAVPSSDCIAVCY